MRTTTCLVNCSLESGVSGTFKLLHGIFLQFGVQLVNSSTQRSSTEWTQQETNTELPVF